MCTGLFGEGLVLILESLWVNVEICFSQGILDLDSPSRRTEDPGQSRATKPVLSTSIGWPLCFRTFERKQRKWIRRCGMRRPLKRPHPHIPSHAFESAPPLLCPARLHPVWTSPARPRCPCSKCHGLPFSRHATFLFQTSVDFVPSRPVVKLGKSHTKHPCRSLKCSA